MKKIIFMLAIAAYMLLASGCYVNSKPRIAKCPPPFSGKFKG